MIRCAFLSSFSSRAFRRSSLRTFSSSGFRSGLRPRFFDRAFSDPLCAALRHVVRCDEYSPQDLTHVHRSASSTIPACRRTEPPAAYLLPLGPQELPRFAWPPRFQGHYHSLPFSLAVPTCSFSLPSPYSNSLRAPCLTYVGREGGAASCLSCQSLWTPAAPSLSTSIQTMRPRRRPAIRVWGLIDAKNRTYAGCPRCSVPLKTCCTAT